jgi:hypothetical protein
MILIDAQGIQEKLHVDLALEAINYKREIPE